MATMIILKKKTAPLQAVNLAASSVFSGTPGKDRTCDLRIRNPKLEHQD